MTTETTRGPYRAVGYKNGEAIAWETWRDNEDMLRFSKEWDNLCDRIEVEEIKTGKKIVLKPKQG